MLSIDRSHRTAEIFCFFVLTSSCWGQASPVSKPVDPGAPSLGLDKPDSRPTSLGMSPAVVCSRVDGYEQYTPIEASLTNADKLKIYFRPLRYKVETDLQNKAPYRAKFVEDGRIRRKGEKTAIAKEDKLLEYETRYSETNYQIFLANTIGLESLTPGEYELDITLHDAIDGQATATQTLPFRIVPGPITAQPPPPEREPQKLQPARTKKARAGRVPKPSG